MTKIWTLDTRDTVLLDVVMQHSQLSYADLGPELRMCHARTVEWTRAAAALAETLTQIEPLVAAAEAQGREWLVTGDYAIESVTAPDGAVFPNRILHAAGLFHTCLLYTSDAADDLPCVDPGGRRIIQKKNNKLINVEAQLYLDTTPTPTV